MTTPEIRDILIKLRGAIVNMDEAHVGKLLRILLGIDKKYRNAFLGDDSKKKYTYNTLSHLINNNRLENMFNPKTMKKIFEIMGDYNWYPMCPLCGKPIIINSRNNNKNTNYRCYDDFSWDHIYPKSLGGDFSLSNLQPMHKECNRMKGDKILARRHYTINLNVNIEAEQTPLKTVIKKYKNKQYKNNSSCMCNCGRYR